MSLPIDLSPQVYTTSNVLLQMYLLAVQFDQAQREIDAVKADRNIASARPDTLQANWGALVEVSFDSAFTADQYRGILLGMIKARLRAPTKQSVLDAVAAFAPSATVLIKDYYKDFQGTYLTDPSAAPGFVGPDPSTYFTLNGTDPGNVWNGLGTVWTPGLLLRQLGFDAFGTQVQVLSVSDPNDIARLRFVPQALEFVRPGSQFLALVYDQEISGI